MDRHAATPDPTRWAEILREPPFEVLRAWTGPDAHPGAADRVEAPRTVWTWLASVLPRALWIDMRTGSSVIHIGSIQLRLQPEPDPVPASAGWPAGSHLIVRAPRLSGAVLPDADGPGWVVSRSDDPETPTLVALAPTVPTLHRELAHRVWHRAVDLLVAARDTPPDPVAVAGAVHEDLTAALSRGWRLQTPWVPAIVEGHPEWSADLTGVPTGSWLDARDLPHPYRLEGSGAVLRARAAS